MLVEYVVLRIAFFSDFYRPRIGGQETRLYELATRLASRGHDVSVHCVAHDPELPTFAVEDGVSVTRWPCDPRFDSPIVAATKRGVVTTVRFSMHVRRTLVRDQPDFAYFNQWPYLHVLAAPRGARRRAAIDWCELRGGLAYGAVQRFLPRLVATNACVNDQLAERLTGASGAPVEYLPSGVVTERYKSAPESERCGLLFIGRFVDTKDLPLLVHSYAELHSRGWTEPLRIVGGGPQAHLLHEALDDMPPDARPGVEVVGDASEEEKIMLLSTSRALVLSSRREGFPVVVAEAMASGLPVATVDRPDNGTAHVVTSYRIGTVGCPTASGLADAIEALSPRWAEFSDHGLAQAPSLHWDRITDRFLALAGRP